MTTIKKRGRPRAKPAIDNDDDDDVENLFVARPRARKPRNEVEAVLGVLDMSMRGVNAKEARRLAWYAMIPEGYDPEKWVDAASARGTLRASASTLVNWRKKGMLEAIQLSPKKILYSLDSINKILSQRCAKQRAD